MTDVQDRPEVMTRPIPAPAVTIESKPFWDAAAEGRFLIKRCNDCGQAHWFPRALCPFCFSDKTVWEESPGEGVIYTYSIMRRSPSGPYGIGYVTSTRARRCSPTSSTSRPRPCPSARRSR